MRMKNDFPLEDLTISDLYIGNEFRNYEIPIYQRNYAWEREEIKTLVHDVFDSFKKSQNNKYYVGTLVSYDRGDNTYEIIDGQQRLTTIYLILKCFKKNLKSILSFKARNKSNYTLKNLKTDMALEESEISITKGFKFAKEEINELGLEQKALEKYIEFWLNQVHIIHYHVPKDIDLNHYFEVMNSRGEQLEKHEIVKARLFECLDTENEASHFKEIWDICSEMNIYAQRLAHDPKDNIYFESDGSFKFKGFDMTDNSNSKAVNYQKELTTLIKQSKIEKVNSKANNDGQDMFQPIIDFPNFLLIVLKFTQIRNNEQKQANLDDKELLNEFEYALLSADCKSKFVKQFAYNLIKAKYFLDNFIVHHSNEDEKRDNNPWNLKYLRFDNKHWYPIDLFSDLNDNDKVQDKMVNLLSMLEVTFTPKQRKNYLLYCLLFLFEEYAENVNINNTENKKRYYNFVNCLTKKIFFDVYLEKGNLNNSNNVPLPNAFDTAIINNNKLEVEQYSRKTIDDFQRVYGNSNFGTKGIPLYVFNYLDYRIWEFYADNIRGKKTKKNGPSRAAFFAGLGCSDFELDLFNNFYFSKTRKSLEHYYPQALSKDETGFLTKDNINCFGNFAMIGSEANSLGSNWTPRTKVDYYLDNSRKVNPVSVATLKLRIMMQICKDNYLKGSRESGFEWDLTDINEHQKRMMSFLFNERD